MIKTWLLVLMMSHDSGGVSVSISPLAYESQPQCQEAVMVALVNARMFANAQLAAMCVPGPSKK